MIKFKSIEGIIHNYLGVGLIRPESPLENKSTEVVAPKIEPSAEFLSIDDDLHHHYSFFLALYPY